MTETKQIEPRSEKSLTRELEPQLPQVGFDPADELPLRLLPEEFTKAAGATLRAATTEIAQQGASGPACRRMLSRDIMLARTQLRFLEGARNTVLGHLLQGKNAEKRLKLLEQLVDQQHRRLLASINTLARLSAGSTVVRINAHQAAVVMGDQR